MSDDTLLGTTIAEPSMTGGEVELLLFALERSRAQFAWKVGGLDAAALHEAHPPSAMTLAGLIKHLSLVEDQRTADDLGGPSYGRQWAGYDGPDWEWRSAADDSPAELYALWQGAVERARGAWSRVLARGASTSRPGGSSATASRRTSVACWSTCTTSTPVTSATPTSSARPPTAWWGRTRRSHDGPDRGVAVLSDRPGPATATASRLPRPKVPLTDRQ